MKVHKLLAVLGFATMMTAQLPATVLTFGSGDGLNESNSVTGTNVNIATESVWAVYALPYHWISFGQTGAGGTVLPNSTINPIGTFWETITIPAGAINLAGTVHVNADDTTSLAIQNSNGLTMLFPANFNAIANCSGPQPIGCLPSTGADINLSSFLAPGINTLVYNPFQTNGFGSGLAYTGSVSYTDTPEPSTFGIMAATLIGLGLYKRRT